MLTGLPNAYLNTYYSQTYSGIIYLKGSNNILYPDLILGCTVHYAIITSSHYLYKRIKLIWPAMRKRTIGNFSWKLCFWYSFVCPEYIQWDKHNNIKMCVCVSTVIGNSAMVETIVIIRSMVTQLLPLTILLLRPLNLHLHLYMWITSLL